MRELRDVFSFLFQFLYNLLPFSSPTPLFLSSIPQERSLQRASASRMVRELRDPFFFFLVSLHFPTLPFSLMHPPPFPFDRSALCSVLPLLAWCASCATSSRWRPARFTPTISAVVTRRVRRRWPSFGTKKRRYIHTYTPSRTVHC